MALRFGRVSSVDASRHTAQVEFPDGDGMVSYDLHVLVGYNGDRGLPEKNDPVACVLDESSPDGHGVVLGVLYTESDEAPDGDADLRAIKAGRDGKVRLGSVDADDAAAKGPSTKTNFDNIATHFDVVWNIITGSTISEPGNGAPSALQIALKAAILGSPFPELEDVRAEKVTVE